jgi:general secretion pathway protein A
MFLEYYNLLEQPFGVTPDTRFLYLNRMYREALASLWYGIKQNRGFMALVSEPGLGKTTLLFQLLQRLRNSNSARTVFLFQTCCDSADLIRYLLQDLGIRPAPDLASMHQQLNEALVREARAGRQFVFVIDEAQNLSDSVLETVRLLSDFETSQGKLLEIILAGQPQLINTLMKPELLQLTQRISVINFLDPLDAAEVTQYVYHRLRVAGYQDKALFTPDALQLVAQESRGIPRNINNICFGALTTAFALRRQKIDRKIVEEVAADQSLSSLGRRIGLPPSQGTPAERSGVLEAAARPSPGPILSRVFPSDWFGRHARHAAYVTSILLALSAGVATWVRPALRAQVFVQSSPMALKSASQPVTAATQPLAETMRPEMQAMLVEPLPPDGVIVVKPRDTLRQISLRYLRSYSPRIEGQLQALNPELSDLDHVEVGQHLRLPILSKNSTQPASDGKEHEAIVAVRK